MTSYRTVKLSKKGQLVIPKDLRNAIGMEDGSDIVVGIENGKITLSPPGQYARSTRGLLKGTWGRTRREIRRYVDRERESWK